MTHSAWWRRFLVRGVFWRQFLRWAVLHVPLWMEPLMIGSWSLFFLLWGPGRRGVMANLRNIKPGSWPVTNFFRTYRVFWNYAWTIADNARFQATGTVPDWEFEGHEHFLRMTSDPAGGILLTAHMGSYDLGAALFARTSDRQIVMVRAPEPDAATAQFEEAHLERTRSEGLRVDFNTRPTDLAFDLLEGVRRGDIVAIQGDRVTPGLTRIEGRLFSRPIDYPAGPFALAMAAHASIHPTFVVRTGRRRYRLITSPAIILERTSRDRDVDLRRGVETWQRSLEPTIDRWWDQWFAFDPYAKEETA